MNISGLLVLLLFAVFAVCIMSVLLTGADAYQRLAHRDQTSYDRRTVTQYIATKVRQNDAAGAVSVHLFGEAGVKTDGNTLQLLEQLEGEEYCTRIYCWDGYIRELFSTPSDEFYPEDGEMIMEAQGLQFSLEGDLLTVTVIHTDGQSEEIALFLRSGEVPT